MFIAEVVGVTIDDEYLDENDRFHINDANLIMYPTASILRSANISQVRIQRAEEEKEEEVRRFQLHTIG